jgi:CheY-like chemotaxis protein
MSEHRILVVDDNRDCAASLVALLELTDRQSAVAYDGIEAVQMAASFRPDVVLLDIGLPRMNGYDVARQIRDQEWGREMILVALTGRSQDEDLARSQAAGFDRHLIKPVDFGMLTNLLTELLSVPPTESV